MSYLYITVLLFWVQACAEKSDFKGTSDKAVAPTPAPPPAPSVSPPPQSDNIAEAAIKPQECSVTNGKVIGSGRCPEHFAVYTVDDGSSPVFGCCALPSTDVLVAGSEVQRSSSCGADEVLTGIQTPGSLNYYCHKINTTRYKLAAAKTSCYYGGGASGSGGATKCGTDIPPAIEQIVKTVMGSDGCVAVPYGALAIKRAGKTCGTISASQLLFRENDEPVPMLPPKS